MEKPPRNPFKICALCRHFTVLESQKEFPQIADSAYLKYSCAKLGWERREDYLMSSEPSEDYVPNPHEGFDCPYWEEPAVE